MSASVCAGLHFPPGVEVSHAYDTGAHWKMMYSMAIRFMIMNIPETVQAVCVFLVASGDTGQHKRDAEFDRNDGCTVEDFEKEKVLG
jgi:hypothetical protein